VASPVHNDFFAEAYGKRRGFATPFGHTLVFDDTEGAPTLYLTLQTQPLEAGAAPEAANFTRLQFQADGSVLLSILDQHTLHVKVDGAVELKLGGGATLNVEGADADAVATLGDGAMSVAIAEALQNYIDTSLKVEFDAHTHPTGMGPSGPPAAPMTAYDAAITSSKLKIPDG
jgi:large exoprotein involved in heme utilization and adhesion